MIAVTYNCTVFYQQLYSILVVKYSIFSLLDLNVTGRGAGSLLGGYLIDNVGMFTTFRIIGLLGGVSGAFYWIVNRLFFRGKTGAGDPENGSMKKITPNEVTVAKTEATTVDKIKT